MVNDELENSTIKYKKNINKDNNKVSRYERGLYLLFFILVTVLLGKVFYLNYTVDKVLKYDFSRLDSLHQIKLNKIDITDKKNKKDKVKYKATKSSKLEPLNKLKKVKEINKINSLTVSKKNININTSNIEELTKLKGIGKVTAQKIITLRDKKGKFTDLNELLEVKGIGKKKLAIIKEFIKL